MERNHKGNGNNKNQNDVKQRKYPKLFWGLFLGTLITIGVLSFSINYFYGKLEENALKIKHEIPRNTTVERKTKELIAEILNNLEQHREEYFQKAIEMSLPQLEQLTETYKKKLKFLVGKSLDQYFQQYVYPSEEQFVKWIYSLKTQYLLIFYKGGDLAKTGWQKIKQYTCEKITDKFPQWIRSRLCEKDINLQNASLKAEEYFSSHFEKILIKPEKLKRFLEKKLTPQVQKLCKSYTYRVSQIIKQNLQKVIKKELKHTGGLNLPEKELNRLTDVIMAEVFEVSGKNFVLTTFGTVAIAKIVGMLSKKTLVEVSGRLAAKKIISEESERLATKLATAIVEKIAAKEGISEAVRIVAGAATSALTCSWGGPVLSAICGVIGGVITWVFGDYVLNQIDYYLHHDEVKKEIHTSLVELKEKLAKFLTEQYSECFKTVLTAVKEAENKGLTIKELSSP